MKKLIALLLVAVLVLAMTACGTVNKEAVAVLWSGEGEAKVPNSMINAMERAMYIKNVAYQHYGAEGNADAQLEQAKQALDAGCAALAVELADIANAEALVTMAQEKDTPIVFFNTPELDGTAAQSHARGGVVCADEASIAVVMAEMVNKSIEKEADFEKLDRNGDGKISCVTATRDSLTLNEKIQQRHPDVEQIALTSDGETVSCEGEPVELMITDDDSLALSLLRQLQALDFNTNRLTTHCIPVYTVGAQADAREFADTEGLEPEELEAMIYTAENLVGAGQLAGVVIQDYDTMAVATATLLRGWFKGNDAAEDIEKLADGVAVSDRTVIVPYIPYQG